MINPTKGAWPEHTYSEADWSPLTHKEALESQSAGYRASKTFAEKAAWEFVEKGKCLASGMVTSIWVLLLTFI